MPVSRKRKKKPRKSKASRAQVRTPDNQELANAWAGLAAHRRHVDERRAVLAAAAAEALVAKLIAVAPDRSDCDLEEELCTQLGVRLSEWAEAPLEEHVPPNEFAKAIIAAAAEAVRRALQELTTEPDGWRPAWQVLAVVASIVPNPLSATADEAVEDLRGVPGGQVLPKTADGPTVTDQVLWTRDGYGSRFGVTAAFSTSSGPDRWYLWDIDACGHHTPTVHSGYSPTPEQALAAWQAGVGEPAAAGTVFAPIDDPSLLAEILPAEEGFLRSGGESAEQFAEYHRSKRLAEATIEAVGRSQSAPQEVLDAATAATQFTAWLQTHRVDQPQPADLKEVTTELADSWHFSGPAGVYSTCSPHRIALTLLHLRNYYQPDFAAQLIALLPDWTSWLATRNGTPPHLAERCRPYALGQSHAAIGTDDSKLNSMVRVTE